MLFPKGTIAGTWPNLRVITTGFRPFGVYRAAPGYFIKKDAAAVCTTGKGKDMCLVMKMIDEPLFLQTPGKDFGVFLLLEPVGQLHPDQIIDSDLHRQGTTYRAALIA